MVDRTAQRHGCLIAIDGTDSGDIATLAESLRKTLTERKLPVQSAPQVPKTIEPSPLDRVEAEIAEREAAVAELERRLADNWEDPDAIAAHRRAREELQSLLARWEALFEEAQA